MADPTLVDTDIFIDAARGDPRAVQFLSAIEQRSSIALSVVTQMELMVGCRDKAELRLLDRALSAVQIIPIDSRISAQAVDLLRTYRLSHGLLLADGFIAATARVLGWPIATKNQRHFRFIAQLNLIAYP